MESQSQKDRIRQIVEQIHGKSQYQAEQILQKETGLSDAACASIIAMFAGARSRNIIGDKEAIIDAILEELRTRKNP